MRDISFVFPPIRSCFFKKPHFKHLFSDNLLQVTGFFTKVTYLIGISSTRSPSSTIRIFSSAPYCLRVALRMSLTTRSAGAFDSMSLICLSIADGEQLSGQSRCLDTFGHNSGAAFQHENRHAFNILDIINLCRYRNLEQKCLIVTRCKRRKNFSDKGTRHFASGMDMRADPNMLLR